MGMALLSAALLLSRKAPVRFVGTITAISGNTLTVKTDADGAHQVNVPSRPCSSASLPDKKI